MGIKVIYSSQNTMEIKWENAYNKTTFLAKYIVEILTVLSKKFIK